MYINSKISNKCDRNIFCTRKDEQEKTKEQADSVLLLFSVPLNHSEDHERSISDSSKRFIIKFEGSTIL